MTVKARLRRDDVGGMPPPKSPTSWLTVEQVAVAAGTTAAQVRRAVAARALAGVSLHPGGGGDWMFRSEDVSAWIDGCAPALRAEERA